MCGIVGAIAKAKRGFLKDDVSMFNQMLVIDSLRGADGTGVWGTMPSGNVFWTKIGGGPHALFGTEEYERWEDRMHKSLTTAFGHNRYGTSGGSQSEHAHPFAHEHIIMMHNGSIWNHAALRPNAPKGSVDSECIAHVLAREDNVVTAIESLTGAYAIIWYNAKTKKTYFCHNEERPLHYLETDGTIYLMSEKVMLEMVSVRNQIGLEKEVLPVPTDRIYCWDHETLAMSTIPYKPYEQPAKVVGFVNNFHDYEYDPAWKQPAPIPGAYLEATSPTSEPEPTSGSEESFKRLCKAVPLGSKVCITPSRLVDWDIKQHPGKRLEAEVTFEGVPLVYKYSSDDVARMDDLFKASRLEGEVVSHLKGSSHFACWLKNIVVVPEQPKWKSFNDISVTFKEWQHIHRSVPCRKCGGKMMAAGLKLTSLQYKPNRQEWTAVCPKCTVDAFKKSTDVQQTLMEAKAGINVQEKAANLGVW